MIQDSPKPIPRPIALRLAQVLAITPLQLVSLLQENDVNARLQRLLEWID